MSRIGKKPIVVPKGIQVDLKSVGSGITQVTVKKGNQTLSRTLPKNVKAEFKNDEITVAPASKEAGNLYGVSRTIVANMIEGLETGFEKKLEINGVGYRAQVKGKELSLTLGFSHPVNYAIPNGIDVKVENNTLLVVRSSDKELLGKTCAEIRGFKPPEPYQGKGIKYSTETIIRKEGKTAGK